MLAHKARQSCQSSGGQPITSARSLGSHLGSRPAVICYTFRWPSSIVLVADPTTLPRGALVPRVFGYLHEIYLSYTWSLSSNTVISCTSSPNMSDFPFHIKEHVLPCQHIRGYARATAHEQEEVLHLAVKQYTPKDNPHPRPGDVTIIAAHANGFPKVYFTHSAMASLT